MKRKFYIENENGMRIDLNNRNNIFLEHPAGLGLVNEYDFADIGTAFYRNVYETAKQDNITGDLVFTKQSYQKYREFVDWIMAAETLTFVYSPIDGSEFFRDVELSYITKTELSTGRWLYAPISLLCTSPWYIPAPVNLSLTQQSSGAMRYPFKYNSSLIYGSSTAGNMASDLEVSGHIPAGLMVRYTGVAENPKFILTEADGTEIGRCELATSISAGETIELSTAYGNCYVKKITAQGETDLLGVVDISKNPYFKVPLNRSCVLRLLADDVMQGTAEARLYAYYRSV